MTEIRERARAFVRGEGCKCAPDHLTAFAESELELARFAPLGDNHHNAHKCPYCNPEREKELALARKQERLECAKAMCSECRKGDVPERRIYSQPPSPFWIHTMLGFDDRNEDCGASAIHERNLAETGGAK